MSSLIIEENIQEDSKQDENESGDETETEWRLFLFRCSLDSIDERIFPPVGLLMCGVYCYSFTALFIQEYLHTSSPLSPILLCLFYTFGLLYIVSYARGALTSPGHVPNPWKTEPSGPYEIDDKDFVAGLKSSPTYWCSRCEHYKPPRTHHCRRCGVCVLKMDHHCIWLHNCVGYFNQKYFFLTTLYSFILCYFVFATSVVVWIAVGSQTVHLGGFQYFMLSLGTFLSFFQGVGLTGLLQFQVRLVISNMTNIEHVCCNGEQPGCHWDTGSTLQNVKEALGENPLLWFLPVALKSRYDLSVDGIFFEQKDVDWDEEEGGSQTIEGHENEPKGSAQQGQSVRLDENTPLL